MAIDATNIPKILVLILHASDAPHLERLLHGRDVQNFVLISARGTVTSELIDVLGLSGTEKYCYLCVAPKSSIADLMTAVTERFELTKPGHGIAFVLPISAMNAILAAAVLGEVEEPAPAAATAGSRVGGVISGSASAAANAVVSAVASVAAAGRRVNRRTSERKKAMADKNENAERFELILSIINQGFSDELMDAAREAGAHGGTVFHARGTARPEEEKFYGISIQHEKEIVAIVARKEQRRAILEAVQKSCGKETEANGVFLALPVEQGVGVG
jgi:nitrogen regulatory protein PII